MPDPAPPRLDPDGSFDCAGLWIDERLTPDDRYLHRARRVLVDVQTPFQRLSIVDSGCYGRALILDHKWQSATADEFLYHEALVQPAMVLHGAPRSVLVLGGGEGATVREVLRWRSVEKVVMVDIDGQVVDACREHLAQMHQGAFDDPRVEVVIGDALAFLADDPRRWDVVISDLSEPTEHGPSRGLFTREYFQRVQRVLAKGGWAAVQAGSASPVELELHARLVRTMASVFAHVHSHVAMVPSFAVPWAFALAGAEPLPQRCDPPAIDALLARHTYGGLRAFDGGAFLALLQTPKYVREAIARETGIFTAADPPSVA